MPQPPRPRVRSRRIVDCHVHLNNYQEGNPVPTQQNVQRLRASMDEHRIAHAVVLTSYRVDDDRPSAQTLLQHVRDDPRIHIVEGVPMMGKEAPDLESVDRRLAAGQTHGLKLYPGYEHFYPNGREAVPVFELAAKHKVPVMIHTGDTFAPTGKVKFSHPIHVDDVAVDFPDVRLVICHLGNPWLTDTAELIYKNENVFADISGLFLGEAKQTRLERYMAKKVRDMITYVGEPDKLLYGTDWPLAGMRSYLEFVRSLRLGREDVEALMWRNAARVFDLEIEGGHRYDEFGPREDE